MKTITTAVPSAIIIIGTLLGSSASSNAEIIIDNWSVNQGPMVNFDFSGNTVTGGMLGGQRKMYLQNASGNGTAWANVSNGMLHLTRTPDAYPDVSQIWDAGVNQLGLGGIDITEGGMNDRLRVFAQTNGRASIGVYIAQDFTYRSLGYFNIPGAGAGNYDLLFSSLFNGSSGMADLRHVGAIYFDIQLDTYGGGATEFHMGTFSIVPAPGAAAAIGLAGLIGLRRRR